MSSTTIAPSPPKPTDRSRLIVPYITSWSEEQDPHHELIERPGHGIAYRDETLADRDSNGVLWLRTTFRPGQGRPEFGEVHPLRQRRAMQRLLCQVCANPADKTEDGVLWLLRDHRDDWPSWPNEMGVTEPPICADCTHISIRLCPALRHGNMLIRAHSYPIAAVRGVLYRAGRAPVPLGEEVVTLDDPKIRWIRAANLVRKLNKCSILRLTDA
jgi:hypothetical protein